MPKHVSASTFIICLLACLGFWSVPTTASAQWLTIPEAKYEERLRVQPEWEEEEEYFFSEPDTEQEKKDGEEASPTDEAIEKLKHRYLALEGAFALRTFNFASDTQELYQDFFFGEKDHFGISVRIDQVRQFSQNAFPFGIGGYYYLTKNVRGGLNTQFAPGATIAPHQSYQPFIEFGFLDRHIVPHLEYRYRDFEQANMHEFRGGIDFYPVQWLVLSPMYQYSITEPSGGGTSFKNNAFIFKAIIRLIPMVELYGRYAYSQHDFEAGAPIPFTPYTQNDGGGGVLFSPGFSGGIFIDYIYEGRNNGDNVNNIRFGTIVAF